MSLISKVVRKSDVRISKQLSELGYEVSGLETTTSNTLKGFGLKFIRKTTSFWKFKFVKK